MDQKATRNVSVQHYLASEMTPNLVQEVETLVHEIDGNLPHNHVKNNHINKPNGEFYLIRIGEELVGVVSYSTTWAKELDTNKKILVSFGELSYRKSRKEIKNIVRRISIKHLKNHLGPMWMFKTFVAVGITVNPRVFTQFNSFFPVLYPEVQAAPPSSIRSFLTELVHEHYGTPMDICKGLASDANSIFSSATNVTENFSKFYKTKDTEITDYFFKHNIFQKDGDQVLLTNKAVVLMGYYSAAAMAKRVLGLKPKTPQLACIMPEFCPLPQYAMATI